MSRKPDKAPSRASMLDELADETPELLSRLDTHAPGDRETMPQLPMADIFPDPNQPRKRIRQETVQSLAEDIARVGVLQPVVVRPAPDWHGFLLVFGERRFRAAQLAGLTHIPAIVRRDLTDVQVLELQWQENAQREDIDEIDKAIHLRRYKEIAGLSWSQLAERMRLTRRHLLRMQQIAEMPERVCELLRERRLSASHIYQLARLPSEERERLAEQAAEEGWSVRSLDERIQTYLAPATPVAAGRSTVYEPILDQLRTRLSTAGPLSEAERAHLREIARVAAELAEARRE